MVIIPAGVPRKPGMTRDDLFNTNASIVRDLIQAVGKNSPKALIGIISNPVCLNNFSACSCNHRIMHDVFNASNFSRLIVQCQSQRKR